MEKNSVLYPKKYGTWPIWAFTAFLQHRSGFQSKAVSIIILKKKERKEKMIVLFMLVQTHSSLHAYNLSSLYSYISLPEI